MCEFPCVVGRDLRADGHAIDNRLSLLTTKGNFIILLALGGEYLGSSASPVYGVGRRVRETQVRIRSERERRNKMDDGL